MKPLRIFLLLFLAGLANAIADEIDTEVPPDEVRRVLSKANSDDGIDKTEARALAEAYFRYSEGFDGGLWSHSLNGSWWHFETMVGPNGVAGQPIRIHVKHGWITKKRVTIIRPPWTSLKKWYGEMLEAGKEAFKEP